jgi:putative ABC transport system permease protein
MKDSFYLACKYVLYNKVRTMILVTCITLIAVLPLSLEILLDESEQQLLSRAERTPLIIGAKGSVLDLIMNTLYFTNETPDFISMKSSNVIDESGMALSIPVYNRYRASHFPIVGTTLDYFYFNELQIKDGRFLALLGECVVGADVARQLGLKPGDSLISTPETVFDIAGIYPLKMTIVGVLKRSHTPDDRAVFVDIKTAWIIEGLVHGHEDLAKTSDTSVILKRTGDNVVANAKLVQYTEITGDNIDSFHFHGDSNQYPITAVIAVPEDHRSGTILQGRYVQDDVKEQIIKPVEVIDELLQNIFRIRNVLDAVIAFVGVATLLAMILVFSLSLRLRQREINTIFKLGCSRMTIAKLVGAEIAIIITLSILVLVILLWLMDYNSSHLVRTFFIQ